MDNNEGKTKNVRPQRHAARLAAVQAIYQLENVQGQLSEVLSEFLKYRLQNIDEETGRLVVDNELFTRIFKNSGERSADIDRLIEAQLKDSWRLERLDSVLRATLRAGVSELLLDERHAAIVINEYVNVAREFFSGHEPGFVNGVLDNVALALGAVDKNPSEIEDFTKQQDISDSWEDEGGA